ncbi:MAG: hypothetical protein J6D13_06040 [Clostridium sp.]|nr:hypothetical protein [Clostridium sp.]
MQYEMEELVPIAADLAKQLLGWESTSMTYEKAEQLMEGVLYCIREAEEWEDSDAQITALMTARQAYETGLGCVERKVRMALKLYHELLQEFDDYGNRCLGDTFFRGLPEFFRWYDMKFEPQNTILVLDYPVLRDLSSVTGVDRIYEFLHCLSLEQEFLREFPAGYVPQLLNEYAGGYRNRIENLCEIVLIVLFRSFSGTREQLRSAVRQFLEKQYGERDMVLMEYFSEAVDGIAIRREALYGKEKNRKNS